MAARSGSHTLLHIVTARETHRWNEPRRYAAAPATGCAGPCDTELTASSQKAPYWTLPRPGGDWPALCRSNPVRRCGFRSACPIAGLKRNRYEERSSGPEDGSMRCPLRSLRPGSESSSAMPSAAGCSTRHHHQKRSLLAYLRSPIPAPINPRSENIDRGNPGNAARFTQKTDIDDPSVVSLQYRHYGRRRRLIGFVRTVRRVLSPFPSAWLLGLHPELAGLVSVALSALPRTLLSPSAFIALVGAEVRESSRVLFRTTRGRYGTPQGSALERETGFEPATLALARRCSTTELFPLDRPRQEGSDSTGPFYGCQAIVPGHDM